MAKIKKCCECGKNYNPDAVARAFEEEWDGEIPYYDDEEETKVCPDYDFLCKRCALATVRSLMNQGAAIMMMNGEEDYDQSFVDRWL